MTCTKCKMASINCRFSSNTIALSAIVFVVVVVDDSLLLLEQVTIWVFPKIVVPQNGWFIMETPIKNGCFGGTTIFGNPHILPEEIQRRSSAI